MAIKLEKVIPIGRRLHEYQGMFRLNEKVLEGKKVIDCGGGPSSFNCEGTRKGYNITSIDPIYVFGAKDIKRRVDDVFDDMFIQIRAQKKMFLWKEFENVDALVDNRKEAIRLYLEDFEKGKEEGRYQFMTLPSTGIEKGTYDMALCSHFLFLYSEHLSLTFHISSLREMMRIADEVRVFPIIDLKGQVSEHLETTMAVLRNDGYEVSLEGSDYEFLKGADKYLYIRKCH